MPFEIAAHEVQRLALRSRTQQPAAAASNRCQQLLGPPTPTAPHVSLPWPLPHLGSLPPRARLSDEHTAPPLRLPPTVFGQPCVADLARGADDSDASEFFFWEDVHDLRLHKSHLKGHTRAQRFARGYQFARFCPAKRPHPNTDTNTDNDTDTTTRCTTISVHNSHRGWHHPHCGVAGIALYFAPCLQNEVALVVSFAPPPEATDGEVRQPGPTQPPFGPSLAS